MPRSIRPSTKGPAASCSRASRQVPARRLPPPNETRWILQGIDRVQATKEYIAACLNVITAEKCGRLRLLTTASNDAERRRLERGRRDLEQQDDDGPLRQVDVIPAQ